MHPRFLDCRLWHKDYKPARLIAKKRIQQVEAKEYLINKFIKDFGLDKKTIITRNTIASGKNIWNYSVTHAKGTTMIMFAKWPIGIDAICIDDIPSIKNLASSKYFNKQEKVWLSTHTTKRDFGLIWTAKEAVYKCVYNTTKKPMAFSQWNFSAEQGYFVYYKGKDKYIVEIGTSEPKYIFCVCHKEDE